MAQSDWLQRAKLSLASDERSQMLRRTPYTHRVASHINNSARKLATEADLNSGKKCLVTDQGLDIELCHVVERASSLDIVSVFPAGGGHKADYHPILPSFPI